MTRDEAIINLKLSQNRIGGIKKEEWIALHMAIEALSAEAEPIVIRAKTFMGKEDFDKWAEDIKRQNKNIVCIPCDAEVASADAVQGEWLYRWNEVECSVCGEFAKDKSNFCPNCGARMKGGTE